MTFLRSSSRYILFVINLNKPYQITVPENSMRSIGSGGPSLIKPTDLILRRRTDLGFTRDRHIKWQVG